MCTKCLWNSYKHISQEFTLLSEICSVCCCCSVTKSYLTLCNPMHCSTPGFSVFHCLPEFAHSCPLSQWCHPTISSSVIPFSCLHLSQHQGLFQWVGSSHQVTEVLELQLQQQSFQWIFRVDFLQDWLVWSPWVDG